MLDAGVLTSIDRREPVAVDVVEALRRSGTPLHTTQPVVAQVWRGGATQVPLGMLLKQITIHPFLDGRGVGRLLHGSRTRDVVDAHVVLVAAELGEAVLTGDPEDLHRIASVLGDQAPAIYAWP